MEVCFLLSSGLFEKSCMKSKSFEMSFYIHQKDLQAASQDMTSTLDTLLHGMASPRIRSQVILLPLLLLHNMFVRLQCLHQPANGSNCKVVYRTVR